MSERELYVLGVNGKRYVACFIIVNISGPVQEIAARKHITMDIDEGSVQN